MSTLSVDTIQGQTTAATVKIPGHVVQCVQTYDNTNEATYSATAFTNITHLNTSITPKVSGSKFLIECTISGAHNDDAYVGYKLYKGTSEITASTHTAGSPGTGVMFGFTTDRASGNNVGHHLQTVSARFLYTHGGDTSTSQEYRVYVSPMRTTGRSFYYNRVGIYNDANQLSGTSSMTIWEIAQ